MKKTIKVILFIIIFVSAIFTNSKVFATGTATTVNETTRVRKEASTKSNVVVLISNKEKVELILKEGDWYKVKYKSGKTSYTGYIREDLLKIETPLQETSKPEEVKEEKKEEVKQEEKSEESNSENEAKQEENNDEAVEVNSQDTIKENEKFKIKNNFEVRLLPLINSTSIGKISENTEIKISEIIGNWCYVETDFQSGWTLLNNVEKVDDKKEEPKKEEAKKEEAKKEESKKEEIKKEESKTETLYVSASTVNLREKADTNSKVVKQLVLNTKVTRVEVVDKTWSKIKASGKTGYVASKYLSKTKNTETTSRSLDEPRTSTANTESTVSNTNTKTTSTKTTSSAVNASSSSTSTPNTTPTSKSSKVTGTDVVAYARKFLGCKYVHGKAGPSEFDCSGFTSYVYKHFGYSLSRTSSGQRSNGTAVKKENLQPGDIVCFSGHVGIYIGGNQFIHAANPKKGVIITSMSDSYYVKNYITARRILK